MNTRMLTLFGEEEIITPEALVAAPKVKAKSISRPKKGNNEVAFDTTNIAILADWVPAKQYYTIGEVAALFDVRTSHIRFWTNEFDLKVRTTSKGDRLYTPALIGEIRTIYYLIKERGFTIPGAKAKLIDGSPMSVDTLDLKQDLLKLRNQLSLISNKLQ